MSIQKLNLELDDKEYELIKYNADFIGVPIERFITCVALTILLTRDSKFPLEKTK